MAKKKKIGEWSERGGGVNQSSCCPTDKVRGFVCQHCCRGGWLSVCVQRLDGLNKRSLINCFMREIYQIIWL